MKLWRVTQVLSMALLAAATATAGPTLLRLPESIELNTANQAELEQVRGIGPDLSRRILESRKQAAFADWADFMHRLSGVGPARASKLSEAGLVINSRGLERASPTGH